MIKASLFVRGNFQLDQANNVVLQKKPSNQRGGGGGHDTTWGQDDRPNKKPKQHTNQATMYSVRVLHLYAIASERSAGRGDHHPCRAAGFSLF